MPDIRFIAIAVLAGMLALSMAGNAWLGRQWLGQRDKATLAEERRTVAADAATQCSAGVGELQARAELQAQAGAAAVAQAKLEARNAQERAQQILASGPAVQGDDYKSAQLRAAEWVRGRARP